MVRPQLLSASYQSGAAAAPRPISLCLFSPYRTATDMCDLPTVNLNHFRLLRVVGKGAFGKVRIVERKDTGLTFALKYIRKDEGPPLPSLQTREYADPQCLQSFVQRVYGT